MRLGSVVSDIRSRGDYLKGEDAAERRAWLDGMGFVWDDLERRWEEAKSALRTYKEMHGDMQVPIAFVVPSSEPWAEETWGMRLGKTVSTIRSRGDYLKGEDAAERRAWLDGMGFVWDDLERRWEEAKSALRTYKEVHGDMQVPRPFVVPSSAPWAEETWGMRLGSAVHDIRSQDLYLKGEDAAERRTWLDEMGFMWRVRGSAAE